MPNEINAELVFVQSNQNPDNEIVVQAPVNQVMQHQLHPIQSRIIYPLPYEFMNQSERSDFERKYSQIIRESAGRDHQDVSDCFAKSTCLTLSCCSTHGSFLAVSNITNFSLGLEFSIPLAIVTSCLIFGATNSRCCPQNVVKCPARSINFLGYALGDCFNLIKDHLQNNDLVYVNSEENKKLREKFDKIKGAIILFDPQEKKFYLAKPDSTINISQESSDSQSSGSRSVRQTSIPSQLTM